MNVQSLDVVANREVTGTAIRVHSPHKNRLLPAVAVVMTAGKEVSIRTRQNSKRHLCKVPYERGFDRQIQQAPNLVSSRGVLCQDSGSAAGAVMEK